MFKHIGVLLSAAIIGAFCLELGENFGVPGVYGFVSSAEAIVNRPLTPVSVGGVARTSAQRCGPGASWDAYAMRCDGGD
jgi:hypothetical protein